MNQEEDPRVLLQKMKPSALAKMREAAKQIAKADERVKADRIKTPNGTSERPSESG